MSLVKGYAAIVGVVLIVVGLLGFIDNPIVGSPDGTQPIFVTGAIHDVIHLATGALALYIAFGLTGVTQANALIGYGVLYAVVLVLTLIDPDLFGILQYGVNAADHVLHAALAIVSIGIGYMARTDRASAYSR